MAFIKVKYRPSSINDHEGTIKIWVEATKGAPELVFCLFTI